MLAVTIDEVPDGDETRRRRLAAVRIECVSPPYSICEYDVCSVEDDEGLIITTASCVCEVRDHDEYIWSVVEHACRAIRAARRDDAL
ncbi:hypothetical protein [Bradyrhizobium sp. ORS 86]|uniref:hypothetical protein n=1 Tax=Bradyrhizobium sp. ORS 86 TaxID=1685970 RepID=UPI00388F2E19